MEQLLILPGIIVITSFIGVTAIFYFAIKLGWLPGVEFPSIWNKKVDKKDN